MTDLGLPTWEPSANDVFKRYLNSWDELYHLVLQAPGFTNRAKVLLPILETHCGDLEEIVRLPDVEAVTKGTLGAMQEELRRYRQLLGGGEKSAELRQFAVSNGRRASLAIDAAKKLADSHSWNPEDITRAAAHIYFHDDVLRRLCQVGAVAGVLALTFLGALTVYQYARKETAVVA